VKRHTQRIVAFAMLGLAGTAFCVDRFVLGYAGPQAAAAATTPGPEHAGAATAPVAPPAVAEVSVSTRLAGLRDRLPAWGSSDERDAMMIPAAWHIDAPKPAEKAESTPTLGVGAKPEAPKFTLSSVVGGASGGQMVAVVNGKLVKVGDQVEGYTVKSIKASQKGVAAAVTLGGPAGEVTEELALWDGQAPEPVEAGAAKPARGSKR
jgi:hypothetical protein